MSKIFCRMRLLLLYFLGIFFVGFLVFCYKTLTLNTDPVFKTDISTAVVFSGTPQRINKSFSLLQQGEIKTIFISGVNKYVRPNHLTGAYELQSDNKTILHLGYDAKNTLGNVIETKKWLQKNKILAFYLVTSYYHIPRSTQLMKAVFPEAIIVPIPVFPLYEKLTLTSTLHKLRVLSLEYIKYLGSFCQIIQIKIFS